MRDIPKTIHYCWFGGNPKSELILKCMESWKKFFPDYEIIEWNDNNYDFSKNQYCKEAYENKKWAFVSDFARLDIIYHYGGIYFDTDVEVLRNFDALLEENGYCCFENSTNKYNEKTVATGLGFAAPPYNKVVETMMQEYEDIHFVNDGEMDLTPCDVRNTKALIKLGLKTNGSFQNIEGINIYPFDYFCGYDITNGHEKITENTYTIHHYAATWQDDTSNLFLKIKRKLIAPIIRKMLGNDLYDRIKIILANR